MPISEEEEQAWLESLEEEDDDDALELLKTSGWILPQTEGFFQAPSGNRLHVRALLPAADSTGRSIKAVMLYNHGLNSHVNGQAYVDYYQQVASKGLAVFAVDIMGHGYSEGTRVLVEDWDDVFDDLEYFLEALMGVADPSPTALQFNAGVSAQVLSRVRQVPIFVHGSSMGGMISMYMGLRLQSNEALQKKFKGVVMVSPSLAVKLPPKAVQVLLRTLVVPFFGTFLMPKAVSSSSAPKKSWSMDLSVPAQKNIAEMQFRDCVARFPEHGMGWNQNMRWGTAGAFSNLYSQIEDDMRQVQYPFLVLHDLEDKVCLADGSKQLMELSPSKDKTFEAVDAKGLHDLNIVAKELIVNQVATWIDKHLY